MDHNDGRQPRSPTNAEAADGSGVAVLMQPWLHLSEQLSPLIGDSGFCALFGRALRLSGVRLDGLGSGDGARPMSELLMSLTRTLNEIEPGQASAANDVLLDTFITLLGSLIGDALTKQLIHVAMDGRGAQKHEQEQK
jgi:hypothetical protein